MINRNVIKGVKAKITEIENALFPTLQTVFSKYRNIIIDDITQEQLFKKGEDGKGASLGSYAESTKRIKIRKRQPIDRVTLRDTGDFHSSITVISQPKEVIIETSIEYAKYLVNKYGNDILSVQGFLLKDFIDKYFIPEMETKINNIISK